MIQSLNSVTLSVKMNLNFKQRRFWQVGEKSRRQIERKKHLLGSD